MNRSILMFSTFSFLAGCCLLAPTGTEAASRKAAAKPPVKAAQKTAQKTKSQNSEAPKVQPETKSSSSEAQPAPPVEEELTPTVTIRKHGDPSPRVQSAPPPTEKPEHQEVHLSKDDQTVPGMPADFGSITEMKAFEGDIETAQEGIRNLLSQLTKRKLPPDSGLNGLQALQKEATNALSNPNIPAEDRQALEALLTERDVAVYMLSASLVTQEKNYQASEYLKFLAQTAAPGTPMRQAAEQQLLQIGFSSEKDGEKK